MAYETIRVSVEDHIQTITLHRPDKLNAFTGQMMNEMIAAFDEADANDDVRVVIVTGEGRAFCAGADLQSAQYYPKPDDLPDQSMPDNGMRIWRMSKPVIASVRGEVLDVALDHTVVEAGGVGYKVMCTPATLATLRRGSETRLITAMIVREDSQTLYGFADADARDLFGTLLGAAFAKGTTASCPRSTSSNCASLRFWAISYTQRATASPLRPGRVLPMMIPSLIMVRCTPSGV